LHLLFGHAVRLLSERSAWHCIGAQSKRVYRTGTAGKGHDQPSESPYDRSALQPEADTLNRMVRSLFTPPERESFKPAPLCAPYNVLNFLDSNIRTKTAVVRLRRRKWGERDGKWPEMGLAAAAGGSDKWPEKPTFCGFPTADQEPKRISRLGVLAEGSSLASNILFAGLRILPRSASSSAMSAWAAVVGYPARRLAAHAGICAGGGEQSPSLPQRPLFNGLETTLISMDIAWRICALLLRSPPAAAAGGPVRGSLGVV